VREKLGVTVASWLNLMTHSGPLAAEQPDQESNFQPALAVAVKLTDSDWSFGPSRYPSEQSDPQSIRPSSLVTVPPGCAVAAKVQTQPPPAVVSQSWLAGDTGAACPACGETASAAPSSSTVTRTNAAMLDGSRNARKRTGITPSGDRTPLPGE
jgi:hypothetical protein